MTRTRQKSGSLPAAIEMYSIPVPSAKKKTTAKRKRPSASSLKAPPVKKRLVYKKAAELLSVGSPPSCESSSDDEGKHIKSLPNVAIFYFFIPSELMFLN